MDIFLPKKHQLRIPKKQVLPGFGDLLVDCGHCGCREFRIHVRPVRDRVLVQEIVCDNCLHVWKVDDKGFVDTGAKLSITKEG